ncbi:MAG: DNA repair protein RadC [Spirochaetes bacterium]|nr:DNA repair protein RadC [Spirochaetota bacterium]
MPDCIYENGSPSYSGKPDVRERLFRSGPGRLTDIELLSALLGSGVRGRGVTDLAADVLAILDSSRDGPDPDKLVSLNGVGAAKACLVSAALELGRRLYGSRERRVVGPADVFGIVSHWADRTRERFIAVTLNGAHEVIRSRVITIGLVNRTVVHPREVFADAVSDRACAVVLAHNHPSGRLDPSPEDRDITTRLRDSGELIGIPVMDHLVFSADGYYSFVEHGLLQPRSPD